MPLDTLYPTWLTAAQTAAHRGGRTPAKADATTPTFRATVNTNSEDRIVSRFTSLRADLVTRLHEVAEQERHNEADDERAITELAHLRITVP